MSDVKSLQPDVETATDYTYLKAEIEVVFPCVLPSLINVYFDEHCHEVSLRRCVGDPRVCMDNIGFKNNAFKMDLNG